MKNQSNQLITAFFALLLLFGTTQAHAQYCTVSFNNLTDDWIENIKFAGIDNTSGSTGYSDYTAIVGEASQALSYEISVTIGNTGSWNQYVTVFIDFNRDEVFDTQEEKFNIGNCYGNCTISGEITIPSNAIPGITRMRVIDKFNAYSTAPCFSASFGEAEDYSLMIIQNTMFEYNGNSSISLNPTAEVLGGRPTNLPTVQKESQRENTQPNQNNPRTPHQPVWDFTIYPNPSTNSQSLQLNLSSLLTILNSRSSSGAKTPLTISVLDLTGRLIWTKALNTRDTQNLRILQNAPTLDTGTYLITITTPSGEHKTKTLFITK